MHLVVHPLCVFRTGLDCVCRRLLHASPAGPSLLIHSHTSSPSSAGPVDLGRETRGPWILVTRCHRLPLAPTSIHTYTSDTSSCMRSAQAMSSTSHHHRPCASERTCSWRPCLCVRCTHGHCSHGNGSKKRDFYVQDRLDSRMSVDKWQLGVTSVTTDSSMRGLLMHRDSR